MTTMTSYPHGVPSWVDLATPDTPASKGFYGELFGWTYDDQPTDVPGMDYTMARKGEHAAAGMMPLTEEMSSSGMPPVWNSYVSVSDIDAAVAKVEPAGGTVVRPVMDVMDVGRMAVINDPTGATLCLWEAKAHIGAEVVNEHGALTWNELMSSDIPKAADFYQAVLGWSAETMTMPGGEYTIFKAEGGNENGIAGAMPPPMPNIPAAWGVYFNVDDVAATVARAKELGATVFMEPTEMEGVGTLAALADPQGAMFSLMTPAST